MDTHCCFYVYLYVFGMCYLDSTVVHKYTSIQSYIVQTPLKRCSYRYMLHFFVSSIISLHHCSDIDDFCLIIDFIKNSLIDLFNTISYGVSILIREFLEMRTGLGLCCRSSMMLSISFLAPLSSFLICLLALVVLSTLYTMYNPIHYIKSETPHFLAFLCNSVSTSASSEPRRDSISSDFFCRRFIS